MNDKYSGNHASNFNIQMSPRHEVKDSCSLHRSIHSYGRFDRFQRCGLWVHRRWSFSDALWTMPPQVTF
jgi:hypothetical protein